MSTIRTIEPAVRRPYFLLWCAVVLFVAIGVASSVNRIWGLREGAFVSDPFRMLPAEIMPDVKKYDNEFRTQSLKTVLHIVPGSIFLMLAPFQFSSRIRTRHLSFHRWSGRLIVVIAVLAGVYGLLLRFPFRFTGATGSSAVIIFGILFLAALIRAVIAIRQHDLKRHREWMIRAFAIGIGISTVRLVAISLILITGRPSFQLLGWSFWIGWTLTLAAGELWIRRTKVTTG